MKIVIVDYGMGNLKSIKSAFNYLGVEHVILSHDLEEISLADKIVLPGVGSFAKAMDHIKALNLENILQQEVLYKKKPILGICLGMQLLCTYSEEDGGAEGLSFIDGNFCKFKALGVKIPHVGFNQVESNSSSRLYKNIVSGSDFYFTHSYRLSITENINSSLCTYGEHFIASYEKGNIAGVQFHPELSQTNGLMLLRNFIERF